MLKTFPKRKMIFVPQAVCKTVVPDTFRVLLSQRRRWINSTIHNLFELMLVRDLCGTFCFSMQFVVFMDLVGTMVLPAAIAFTLYIIMISILPTSVTHQDKPIISLILLAFILGLPGLLIVITSRKLVYVGWMLIYLVSLPIWNFVLPAYAFWHMDDFSWGETRKIEGAKKESDHGDKEGTFDSTQIVMKRWVEFERERRWKSGTHSRSDSYYDVMQRSSSPKRSSMASNSGYSHETSGDNPFRPSQSFGSMSPLDTLEPPLTRFRQTSGRDTSPASTDSAGHSGPDDDGAALGQTYAQGYAKVPPTGDEAAPIMQGFRSDMHRDSASSGLTADSEVDLYQQYQQPRDLYHQPETYATPPPLMAPSGMAQSASGRVSLVDDGAAPNAPQVRRMKNPKRNSLTQSPPPAPSQPTRRQGGLPPGAVSNFISATQCD